MDTNFTPDKKRELFGPGPWVDEPDRVEWRAHGFVCLVRRSPMGNLCGYVGVPPEHPWHGKSFEDIEAFAHGSLTYAGPRADEPEHRYWVGFDAGHAFDLVPELAKLGGGLYEDGWSTYRDIEWMKAEVEQLAAQAAAAEAPRG